MTTCMFTGHRPKSLPFGFNENDERCIELKKRLTLLIREKIEEGITRFVSGMAMGVDLFAAEIVLSLKSEFPEISLIAVVPCAGQADRWSAAQAAKYNAVLSGCDDVVILQEEYTRYCMHMRNRYMVEHSDCVIAVWNGESGGTGSTVGYAQKKKLPITILNPETFSVQKI